MIEKEKLSVLMTVYNAEKYLKYSVNSILKQTYKNWKLIIVDDGSTDRSINIIKNFKDKRIRLIKQKKHCGRTKSLNHGLKAIKSKYIAILDADDVSYKNRFNIQLNFLKKNKHIDVIGTWYEVIDGKGKILKIKKTTPNLKIVKRKMFYKNIFCHSSIMFRKKILKKVKNYPEKFIYMQDYAFILKAMKYYKITLIPKVLVKNRMIKSSMTFSVPQKQILKERLILFNYTMNNFRQNFITKVLWSLEYLKTLLKLVIVRN
jgi:glycosyltransferase involved in cell wall biosynthesis